MNGTDLAANGANGNGHDTGGAAALERLVTTGDLSKLSSADRVRYYSEVCRSVGLNPLTRPLDYLLLNGKLVLYARKDATEQLRTIHGVSITRLEKERDGDLYLVTAYAANAQGRTDMDMGAVSVKGLAGDALANAYLKALTKAKRRVTLSICGLGFLDESEVSSIPDARTVQVADTGEIVEPAAAPYRRACPDTIGDTAIQHVPHDLSPHSLPADVEADADARHAAGAGRTADTVDKAQWRAGIAACRAWCEAHEVDFDDAPLVRYLVGWALGREVTHRKELTGADWGKANHELRKLAAEDTARLVAIHMEARQADVQVAQADEEPAEAVNV